MIPTYCARIKAARFITMTLAGIALSGLSCLTMASADNLTDPLESWSMVENHTPGLVLDNTNPAYFYKGLRRVRENVTGSAVGSFTITPHLRSMTSFAAFVYFWTNRWHRLRGVLFPG